MGRTLRVRVGRFPDLPTATNLAMLATSDELAMWQDRKVNGPYRVTGDVSTNSPGHWAEMNATLSLNFSSERWSGPTNLTGGRVNKDASTSNDPPGEAKRMAADMRAAAYASMINENTTVPASIITELVWHAGQTNLNFGSRTLYPYSYYDDINPLFMMAVWMSDLVVAYEVCRSMGVPTSTQEATIEGWFTDFADLCEEIIHDNLSAQLPNRKSGSYASRSDLVDGSTRQNMRNAAGTAMTYPSFMKYYNNRRNEQASTFGLIGVVTSNQFFIDEYKRYMREWVMFANSISGTSAYHWGDVNRGTTSAPQLGFSYALGSITRLLTTADALARTGDTSVYDFSSSEGSAHPTAGTNHLKTMEQCLDVYMGYVNRTGPAFYTDSNEPPSAGIVGNNYYRVHSRYMSTGNEIVADAGFLLAANYFGRLDWQNTVLRVGHPVSPAYTTTPQWWGNVSGWRVDRRHRFLRSLDANPYGS